MDKDSERETRPWAYSTSLAMIALMALMLSLMASAYAAELTYGPYRAMVVKVLDGDTVQLEVGLWPGLTQRINLRLVGVNTPEKRGPKVSNCEKKAGQDATTFTQRWLQGVKEVTISEVRHDKYAGRALGKLRRLDGKDLAEALITSGHARPYDGGKRGSWCLD
jgi:endonuclease YncB( thermonuclease family)